jgi:alkylated DNA repair dioxygenase AlkB
MKNVASWYALPETQDTLVPVSNTAANGRKILQYGYYYTPRCNYTPRYKIVERPEISPIPDVLIPLKEHAEEYVRTVIKPSHNISFDQCIVNRYLPREGISPHRDDIFTFGPVIACYTFLAGREMEFQDCDDSHIRYFLHTKPNTMYIMTGDARYKWTHQMRSRKNDVVNGLKVPRAECFSVTFRQIDK